MQRSIRRTCIVLLLVAATALPYGGRPALAQQQHRPVDPWREYVDQERWDAGMSFFLSALMDACKSGADFQRVEECVLGCMVCAYFPRMENRLCQDQARRLRAWLASNRRFTGRLLFAINPGDDAGRAFEIIYHLVNGAQQDVLASPGLAIAYAVVWDSERPDPSLLVQSFRYFTRQRGRMEFDLSAMPPEVAQYVIDTHRPIQERMWALDRFGHTDDIGGLYRKIWQDKYDYDALEGEQKEVDRHGGATLPNIYRYGGVCHEAAVFATEVAKAKGIPSVYVSGPTPTGVAHAWVGYMQMERGRPVWARDTGRIGEAETVAGNVRHPQSGQYVPEHELDFALAALMHPQAERTRAQTWHTAAGLLQQAGSAELARSAMYSSLNACVYDSSQWRTFAALAERGVFSARDALQAAPIFARKLRPYPNLAVDAVQHLTSSGEGADPNELAALYDTLVADFEGRDLIEARGRALLMKGQFLEEHGLLERALEVYTDAIDDSLESQTVAIALLDNAGRVLVRHNQLAAAIKLHKRVYDDVPEPARNVGAIRSTWARVALRLAKLHALGGDRNEHDRLIRKILRYQAGSDRYLSVLERRLGSQDYWGVNRS